MNFESFLRLVRPLTCFDFHLLAQALPVDRATIRVQLARWMKAGKVIGLRRGMYTLGEMYRGNPVEPASLAHLLYVPSYLSGLWALGFHDLIPERVIRMTSVTPRVPRLFENPVGIYEYRNIKQKAFFGYREEIFGASRILVAEPEKALLDHWHLSPGEWTLPRLEEMRYQHWERVNGERLRLLAGRFGSPRLERAAERWLQLASESEQGTVTL